MTHSITNTDFTIINLCSEFTSEVALTTKHWSFEENFKYNYMEPGIEAYPFRTFRTGAGGSLHIISKTLQDNVDKFCTSSAIGFTLIVHAPYEIPIMNYHNYEIPYNRSTDVLITPKIILPSTDLDAYRATERKCFFQSEPKLKYFKIYTQTNCFVECGWNKTLNECGCASIRMPREWKTYQKFVINSKIMPCILFTIHFRR